MDWCIILGEVIGILLRSTYWKDSKGQTEQVPGGGRNSHRVFDPADLTMNWETNIISRGKGWEKAEKYTQKICIVHGCYIL